LCDGDACESRSSDSRTDTWNDEWFESVRAEVEDFFACTSIYDGVTLLELDVESIMSDEMIFEN
jgi:hypothetical protein